MGNDLIPDLNQTIVAAVQARVEAEMLKALSGDEVIASFVTAALQEQVPVTNDRYDRKTEPYVRNVLRKTIKEVTHQAVTRLIEEEMPSIETAIRKSLRRNIDSMTDGLVENLAKQAKGAYGIKIELRLPGDG